MRLPGDVWFNQMLLQAWLEEEDDDNNEWFCNQLNGEGHRRCDCHLPWPTLLLPSMETTPWMKLYAACHDHAFITITGLDYDCFAKLLAFWAIFSQFYSLDSGWTDPAKKWPLLWWPEAHHWWSYLSCSGPDIHTYQGFTIYVTSLLQSDCHAIGHVDAVQEADNHQDSPKPWWYLHQNANN
jgi:hypothetical protein